MKKLILAFAMVLAGVFAFGAPTYAAEIKDGVCGSGLDPAQLAAAGCDDAGKSVTNPILNIIQIVIGVVGLLAVLIIVVGGQRFVTSAGDPNKITQAKNMILYAVVAVVVAILAFAITSFVSGAIESNANKGGSGGTTTTQNPSGP